MNQPPFEAFSGNQPYIFISYAHLDAELVFPIIREWHNKGYRIWYDEGIDPGNEWPEEIANALEGCTQFIVFISPRSVMSKNVRNEVNFALDMDKDFIAVHLEKTDLPSGLRLRMGDIQAIMKFRMPDTMFENKMNRALLEKTVDITVTGIDEKPVAEKPGPSEETTSGTVAEERTAPPPTEVSASDPDQAVNQPVIPDESATENTPTPDSATADGTTPRPAPQGGRFPGNPWSAFRYKNIANMTPNEVKNAVIADISVARKEAAALFKSEMKNLKKSGAKRKERRAERKTRLAAKQRKELELKQATKELLQENSELTDEIRREIRKSLKKDGYKKRRGCFLRVPIILISISIGVYFVFFTDRYSSLSDDFLEMSCPSVYSREKKIELINHYDTTLKTRQKKRVLEEDIHKCEAASAESVIERELGLESMPLDELESLLMSRTETSLKPTHKMLRKFVETNARQKMEKMNPQAREFLEGFMEERYKRLLIRQILDTADMSPPLQKKPGQK